MSRLYQAQYTPMLPSARSQNAHGQQVTLAGRAPYLARGLRSVGYGIVIGLGLALLRGHSPWITLVYSVCIAFLCWVTIDLGRRWVTLWLDRRYGLAKDGWPGWPWMIVIVTVGSAIAFLVGNALGDLLTGQRTPSLYWAHDPRQTLSDLLVVLVPSVVITFFFYSRSVIADREAAAQVARRQAAESRLRLLESQLEPHMFFNTLANLHVLIGLDPPRAQLMLDQLIAFLRATLSASRVAEHPLRSEFARLRDYLSLMQVRMEERLRVRLELPQEIEDVPVPPLLLQPLVENSIKHGLEPAVRGGRIEVTARREDTALVVVIRDTGVGIAKAPRAGQTRGREGTGFGLEQVRERLATHYGPGASLQLRPAEDEEGGMVAIVRIPVN